MTLSKLSKRTGVAVTTLSRMENNRMVGTLESHLKIAQALGMPLGALYGERGKGQPPDESDQKLIVLEGHVEVQVSRGKKKLRKGDSLSLSGEDNYTIINRGKKSRARILSVKPQKPSGRSYLSQ